jgi:hypothetical protein
MSSILSAVSSAVPLTTGGFNVPGGGPVTTCCQSGGPSLNVGPGGGFGLAPLAGVLIGVLSIVVVLAIVGVFVIIVVANRADPDPTGRRPQSVYYFAVSFVTLLTSVVGSAIVVSSLVRLIGHSGSSIGDSVARIAVVGGLITLVSLFLLIVHLRRGLELARARTEPTSPSRRVGQSYVSAVAFVSVLVLLVVTVFAIYLVFAIAGPGVFGSFGGHTPALRYLIDSVYFGVVAVVILRTHRRFVPPAEPEM